jgi:Predicted xylanase/chitin deacetylase
VIIAGFKAQIKRNLWGMYVLCVIIFMSCSKTIAVSPPLPKSSPLETVIKKIKQNSKEIEKYFLFDKSGELIVKADIVEETEKTKNTLYFQVLYDMKQAVIESSGEYLITFILKNLETEELYEDKLLWKPQKDNAGILLSFDDDFYDVWESYFDLFDRYDAKVTFFVLGKYNKFSGKALERGHDIGYHTLNHLLLPNVSRQSFFIQTLSQVENFRNAKVPLVSFAYPFGLYETWMHDELLKTYKLVRGFNTSFQAYDKTAIREGFVFSRSIDNIIFKHDDDFMATVDIMLRAVKFTGKDLVLPLTTHVISDDANWGIKPYRLEYILKTANDLQLNFYRYSDFF